MNGVKREGQAAVVWCAVCGERVVVEQEELERKEVIECMLEGLSEGVLLSECVVVSGCVMVKRVVVRRERVVRECYVPTDIWSTSYSSKEPPT